MKKLTDGVILLRRYRKSDIKALYEAAHESRAEIYPWMEWCHPDYSRQDSANWVLSRKEAWDNGSEYSFIIWDASGKKFLGGTGLNHFHKVHKLANLGYWVRSSATGRGAASRATRLVAHFGLFELGLERVEIIADVNNAPSNAVALKAGATREGILRKRLYTHGHGRDAVMYSLTSADFKK